MSDEIERADPLTRAFSESRNIDERKIWLGLHLSSKPVNALADALPVLSKFPQDPEILILVIVAALLDEKPQQAHRYLDHFIKRYVPIRAEEQLLRVIAFGQQELWQLSAQQIRKRGQFEIRYSVRELPISPHLYPWFHAWLDRIEREDRRLANAKRREEDEAARKRSASTRPAQIKTEPRLPVQEQSASGAPEFPPLQRAEIKIQVSLALDQSLNAPVGAALAAGRAGWDEMRLSHADFGLRHEYTQLGLLQGFDELLCLSTLAGVETFWYQVEAVRKVLKQFRGRVLLADEVGLGKTIEAGMALKEYLLRGMAERVLILTPATLVGQWQEEMASKFGIEFATTYDQAVRTDPEQFWAAPRVIASIATARRPEHRDLLSGLHYDLVIVDEAHHLKNRQSANWKLVNALQKRFLLLLTATPVQNSLVELYNLLTLLKPGLFKTEKDFRARYVTSGRPRVPANREQMRDLVREVMIRNTRSLIEVKLPPRHAVTMKLEPLPDEGQCYAELSRLVAEAYGEATTQRRLALRHLISAAGSTATTAAAAIRRFLQGKGDLPEWHALEERYRHLEMSSKEKALGELLERNPFEKKMIFVHHRETLRRISMLLDKQGLRHVIFEGGMTGPEKDTAVNQFRDESPIMICTESGGEGRNLQFCNTLINFDLPWNPMAIEQRIGRLHRIGQMREVFVFNLVTRQTLEEQVLRILDEKINMFELVVGEIDAILGEMNDERDFADLVFKAWVETTESDRARAFAALGEQIDEAKAQYDNAKTLDEELFGEDFTAV